MDHVVMQRLAAELDAALRGGRIEQVWAVPKVDVVVAVERRSGPRLWFSGEPDQPHLYLRDGPHVTPERPPGFAMAARNLLVGRHIAAVRALGGDRIVELACTGDAPTRLVFELIPRRATVFLVDGDGVVRSVWLPRRGRPSPGDAYEPPAPDTRPPAERLQDTDWESLRAAPDADALVRSLLRSVAGMSPLVAREIAWRLAAGDALPESLRAETERARNAPTEARIYAPRALDELTASPPARHFLVAPYPLRHLEADGLLPAARFDSLAAAAGVFFPLRACLSGLDTAREELTNGLEMKAARLRRTLDAVKDDADSAGDAQTHRQWADLLLAYPGAPREGASVRVADPYASGAEVAIPVDPALSRVDNAQAYYGRARRAERSAARTAQRRAALQARIGELATMRQQARDARDIETCLKLARAAGSVGVELVADGWLSAECNTAVAAGRAPDAPPPRPDQRQSTDAGHPGIDAYESSDGFAILVGRNARANERLTRRLAAPDDFWLHAEGPGSHVLIRNPRRTAEPTVDALREAASLAAHFSRARGATKVNVHWTQARYVKKPRGAPAGQVVMRQSRTVLAEPLAPEELFGEESEDR